jgi:hypothetical protein
VHTPIETLFETWQDSAAETLGKEQYSVRLPISDAARIAALGDLFPGRTTEQLIRDLLGAALDELHERMPYVEGDQVVAKDEEGDPIYADIGLTPKFHELAEHYAKKMSEAS